MAPKGRGRGGKAGASKAAKAAAAEPAEEVAPATEVVTEPAPEKSRRRPLTCQQLLRRLEEPAAAEAAGVNGSAPGEGAEKGAEESKEGEGEKKEAAAGEETANGSADKKVVSVAGAAAADEVEKRRRAERFGLDVTLPEGDKKKLRAERCAGSQFPGH